MINGLSGRDEMALELLDLQIELTNNDLYIHYPNKRYQIAILPKPAKPEPNKGGFDGESWRLAGKSTQARPSLPPPRGGGDCIGSLRSKLFSRFVMT
ncbi:protein of unknown function [Denitratisoma oestradiolicum]|uniref:Uncharacterized protein n=1 Tax=Denitratisoma oestradiolicum TaxID=311182 RepID=A0A6S6Y069_9PROT|nr:protein of unknown function [Denitratisoma oestradiolicum]